MHANRKFLSSSRSRGERPKLARRFPELFCFWKALLNCFSSTLRTSAAQAQLAQLAPAQVPPRCPARAEMLACRRMSTFLLSSFTTAQDTRSTIRVERAAASGHGWTEVFLAAEHAARAQSADDSVAAGFSVVILHDLLSKDECETLRSGASSFAHTLRKKVGAASAANPVRMPIKTMLCADSQELCDTALLRGVARLRDQLPLLLTTLFGGESGIGCPPPSPISSSIARDERLIFVSGEPACNVYFAGGHFRPHEDQQALTVLVTLSDRTEFAGGGTAFWSEADRPPPIGPGVYTRAAAGPPTMVLTLPAGTALIFCGNVTHAGQPVLDGERTVFVASFSTRISRPPEQSYSYAYSSKWSIP